MVCDWLLTELNGDNLQGETTDLLFIPADVLTKYKGAGILSERGMQCNSVRSMCPSARCEFQLQS